VRVVSVLALSVALLCAIAAGTLAFEQRDGQYWCTVDSRTSTGPAFGSLVAPEAVPAAEWQWWPMGTACTWITTSGPEQVEPSWALTTLTVIATAGTATATALATVVRNSRHDSNFHEAR
jgi:hypothetical protein